jgi:hypothetical protein
MTRTTAALLAIALVVTTSAITPATTNTHRSGAQHAAHQQHTEQLLMGLPGLIGSQVPDGPDAVWRDISALKAQVQQVQAQVGSAKALVELANQQIANQAAVIALLGSISATSSYANSGMALPTVTEFFTLTVPAGMTKVSYTAFASGSGRNTTASSDFLLINVAGPNGGSGFASATVAVGATIYVTTGAIGTAVGLTAGQVMQFSVSMAVGTSWAANSANTINAQVLGVFQP